MVFGLVPPHFTGRSARRRRSAVKGFPRLDGLLVYILTVVFVATLIRSTFGFGETLVGLPLLAFRIPVETAAPLAVLISITVAAVIVAQDWRHIQMGSAGRLVFWTLFGIPVGLLLLKTGEDTLMKAALALIVMAFSAWSLTARRPPELEADSRGWLMGCGFVAGVFGGAYGLNGPPLIVYGAMRRWSAPHFRATLQAYFLPASILGMAGYAVSGLWTPAVTHYYVATLPATAIAIILGRALNQRLKGDAFLRYVYAGLFITGAMLLFHAARG
jgi:uncharacterized membrane protein YfcA